MTTEVILQKTFRIGTTEGRTVSAISLRTDADPRYPNGRIIVSFEHVGGGYSEHLTPEDAEELALAIQVVIYELRKKFGGWGDDNIDKASA